MAHHINLAHAPCDFGRCPGALPSADYVVEHQDSGLAHHRTLCDAHVSVARAFYGSDYSFSKSST